MLVVVEVDWWWCKPEKMSQVKFGPPNNSKLCVPAAMTGSRLGQKCNPSIIGQPLYLRGSLIGPCFTWYPASRCVPLTW